MAGIEELHFEVILDHTKFDTAIGKIQAAADALNTSLSNALNLTKSVNFSGMTTGQNQYTQSVEKTNTALSGTQNIMRTISQLTGVAFGVVGLRRFTAELIKTAGAFEVQKAALSSMLQDAEKADEIFSTLRKNSLESPYTFQDLAKFAKQLIAFNIPADQLVETEKRLADVAAGLGVDMGRIILAYGQVKAAGVLKGQELRQFTEAGVPILEQLAKQIEEVENRTVSLSEVFNRVTKKQIPFEMVEEAFRRMTNEGGKFYNMQEVLVETLQGKIGKLRDVWQQALYDLGSANEGLLKGGVDALTKLVANLSRLGEYLPEVIASLTAFKTVQIATEIATNSFVLANHRVLASLKAIGLWIARNPYALLAAALVVVTTEAIKFGKKLYEETHRAEIAQRELGNAIKEAAGYISAERAELDRLTKIASNEANSMKTRKDAIDVINAKYNEYLSNLGIEKVTVDNLTTSYNQLANAIANKYLAELKEKTVGKQTTSLADARTALLGFNADYLRGRAITGGANKGKTYGAGGLGLIQGEVERLLNSGAASDVKKLMNGIATIYKKYGLDISGLDREQGKLYKVVYDYVESTKLLQNAERNFNNFAAGYGSGLGLSNNSSSASSQSDTPTATGDQWGNDWKPLKGAEKSAEKIKDTIDKISVAQLNSVMEETDKELLSILKQTTTELDKELDKRFKAMNEWDEFVDKFNKTKNAREGQGAAFKLSGLIGDLKKDDYGVLVEYRKQLENLKEQFGEDSEAFKNGKKTLDEWRESMEKANRSKFAEKVRGLSSDIFKEALKGYDMTNFGDKSLNQLLLIEKALNGLEVPQGIKDALKDYPDILDDLIKEVVELGESTDENTIDPEKVKKIRSELSFVVKRVSDLADAIADLSDSMGDVRFGEVVGAMGEMASMMKQASDAYKTFGGAAGSGAAAAWITTVVAINIKALQLAAEDARKEREFLSGSIKRASIIRNKSDIKETMFGSSDIRQLDEVVARINKVNASIDKYRDKIDSFQITSTHYGFWHKLFGWMNSENYKDGELLPDVMVTLSNIEGVFDKYGNLDADVLQNILDTYSDLTDDERLWIERAISDSKDYANAVKEVADLLSNVYGDIASDAADTIIDSWIEAGDAALDYAEILDDVAKRYAKMLIQDAILKQVLTEDRADEIADKFIKGDSAAAMEMIAGDMERIAGMAPQLADILSVFDPYFLRNSDDASGNSLGNGIKSITEDTANLLASYLNAIRADVSVMRGLQERNLEAIGSSLPTLNDYLAQISASNYDIARSNQTILTEIQSVIGSEGSSGQIVRVSVV